MQVSQQAVDFRWKDGENNNGLRFSQSIESVSEAENMPFRCPIQAFSCNFVVKSGEISSSVGVKNETVYRYMFIPLLTMQHHSIG